MLSPCSKLRQWRANLLINQQASETTEHACAKKLLSSPWKISFDKFIKLNCLCVESQRNRRVSMWLNTERESGNESGINSPGLLRHHTFLLSLSSLASWCRPNVPLINPFLISLATLERASTVPSYPNCTPDLQSTFISSLHKGIGNERMQWPWTPSVSRGNRTRNSICVSPGLAVVPHLLQRAFSSFFLVHAIF